MSEPLLGGLPYTTILSTEEAELRYLLARIDLISTEGETELAIQRGSVLGFHIGAGLNWKRVSELRRKAQELFEKRGKPKTH